MNNDSIKIIASKIVSKENLVAKIFDLDELFDNPSVKVAMTAGELIFQTSKRSIKYAKGCISHSKKNDPKNGRWTFSVKCNQTKSKGPYDVRFKLIKGKGSYTTGMLGREVEISCNCNAWKYNGSDFNALQKDYSERQYSNGQPPNVRDPQRKYLICKHVAASVPLFKKFLIPDEFKAPEKQPKKIIPGKPGLKEKVQPKPFGKQPVKQPEKTLKKQPTKQPVKQPEKPFVRQPIKRIVPQKVKPLRNLIPKRLENE